MNRYQTITLFLPTITMNFWLLTYILFFLPSIYLKLLNFLILIPVRVPSAQYLGKIPLYTATIYTLFLAFLLKYLPIQTTDFRFTWKSVQIIDFCFTWKSVQIYTLQIFCNHIKHCSQYIYNITITLTKYTSKTKHKTITLDSKFQLRSSQVAKTEAVHKLTHKSHDGLPNHIKKSSPLGKTYRETKNHSPPSNISTLSSYPNITLDPSYSPPAQSSHSISNKQPNQPDYIICNLPHNPSVIEVLHLQPSPQQEDIKD